MQRTEIKQQLLASWDDLPDLNFWSESEPENLPWNANHFSFIIEELLRHGAITEKTTILDAGCGESHLAVALKKQYDPAITATDLFEKPRVRLGHYGIPFIQHDFCKDPFPFPDDAFDIVILTDIIEHLTSGQHALMREVRRVLRPGGIAIVGTPNILSFPKRIKFVLGYSPLVPFREETLQDHIHEYSLAELEGLLKEAGFTDVRGRVVNRLWEFLRRSWAVRQLYRYITTLSPSLGDYLLVVVRK